jgi:hypothetical protein
MRDGKGRGVESLPNRGASSQAVEVHSSSGWAVQLMDQIERDHGDRRDRSRKNVIPPDPQNGCTPRFANLPGLPNVRTEYEPACRNVGSDMNGASSTVAWGRPRGCDG